MIIESNAEIRFDSSECDIDAIDEIPTLCPTEQFVHACCESDSMDIPFGTPCIARADGRHFTCSGLFPLHACCEPGGHLQADNRSRVEKLLNKLHVHDRNDQCHKGS